MNHTPTPWKVSEIGVGFEISALIDGKLEVVAQTQQLHPFDRDSQHSERKANARYIVLAVNHHEELVRALKAIVDPDDCSLDHHGYCQMHGGTKPCGHSHAKALLARIEKEAQG